MKFLISLTLVLIGYNKMYPTNMVDACSGGGDSTSNDKLEEMGELEDVEDKNIYASKYK